MMLELSNTIKKGIYDHGIVTKNGKRIFAYEVSGYGDYRLMDDANLPSLLSLPYMEFISVDDPLYS